MTTQSVPVPVPDVSARTAPGMGGFNVTVLKLEEIEFRLLEQPEDFEHVVFGQLHQALSAGRRCCNFFDHR